MSSFIGSILPLVVANGLPARSVTASGFLLLTRDSMGRECVEVPPRDAMKSAAVVLQGRFQSDIRDDTVNLYKVSQVESKCIY